MFFCNISGVVQVTKLANRPKLLQTLEHDESAFTQGLIVHNGFFYESTGMYGTSFWSYRSVLSFIL